MRSLSLIALVVVVSLVAGQALAQSEEEQTSGGERPAASDDDGPSRDQDEVQRHETSGAGANQQALRSFELQISGLSLIMILIVGALIYAVLRWVRSRLLSLQMSKRRRIIVDRTRPLIEAVTTIAYVLWAVGYLLGDHPLYTTIVLGALVVGFVWISWFAIRDVVAGMLLKASELCLPGDHIEIGGVSGRVRGLGYRVVALDMADGNQAFIPYSRFSRETLVRKPVTDGVFRHSFEVTVPPGLGIVEGKKAISCHALNSHWHSVVKDPSIEVDEEGVFRVTVFAVAANQGHRIEASVRRALDQR